MSGVLTGLCLYIIQHSTPNAKFKHVKDRTASLKCKVVDLPFFMIAQRAFVVPRSLVWNPYFWLYLNLLCRIDLIHKYFIISQLSFDFQNKIPTTSSNTKWRFHLECAWSLAFWPSAWSWRGLLHPSQEMTQGEYTQIFMYNCKDTEPLYHSLYVLTSITSFQYLSILCNALIACYKLMIRDI